MAKNMMAGPAWLTEDWLREQMATAEKEWLELMHEPAAVRAEWLRDGGALSKVGYLAGYACRAAIAKASGSAPADEPNAIALYHKALAEWGAAAQLHQGAEEASELAVALSHLARTKDNAVVEVLDEMADMEIMLGQVRVLMEKANVNVDALVQARKRAKLAHLAHMLEAQ